MNRILQLLCSINECPTKVMLIPFSVHDIIVNGEHQ
jgi:hypothetical protein